MRRDPTTMRFLLASRVPSDPSDAGNSDTEITYDILLTVAALTRRVNTDWMIYANTKDVADALQSPKNKYAINSPQREDIAHRFEALANEKLPISRQIAHNGYRIAACAQTFRMRQSCPQEWTTLLHDAEELENIADRALVMHIVALCLPKGMGPEHTRTLEHTQKVIGQIPWEMDQLERYIGLAEDVHGINNVLCRDLVALAAGVLSSTSDDVSSQQRRLVDLAFRLDETLAKNLIEHFDDDQAKRSAQLQLRLLEVRKSIGDNEGRAENTLQQIGSRDLSRLGWTLVRALNAGRVQSCHPSDIREYLAAAADQPLRRSFSILLWYIDNSVVRFAKTDQAASFLRPMLNACIVDAQLAGQVAGKTLTRLKALKHRSIVLSDSQSLLVVPGTREEAIRVLSLWFEEHVTDTVKIVDPYFGPDDLSWLQLIRTAKPGCSICVLTARKNQPIPSGGQELDDIYGTSWRRLYDQSPPKAEIAVIGCELTKDTPIHDRWIVTGPAGLRLGTSLHSLGTTKDSEISEMSPKDCEQKQAEIDQYLNREKTEHNGQKISLLRFWLT